MEWHLKVPKIFHVYWGGGVLPYIRFLTVKSFMIQNPDWEIMFWYPERPTNKITWHTGELDYSVKCDNYMSELFKLPIKSTPIDFCKIGFLNDISENFKSDYMRAYLLSTMGGVWSDMDIIYFRPITNLLVNTAENKDIETFVCISAYGHSNGFLMSSQENKFYEKCLLLARTNFNPSMYQSIGPTLYNAYFRKLESISKISSVVNMEMDTVYSHDATYIKELIDGHPPKFTDRTIGCHWYAGHEQWKEFFQSTNGGLTNLPNNIIGNLIKSINNG